ncbi:putative nuclease harbi1, partial [Phtheirospermum japonicum]
GCLGVLDGKYIQVQVPFRHKPHYRNRKGEVSVNVLGFCGPNMNYIFILTGWEGSTSDSHVLRDAITSKNGLKLPNGQYYLCDCSYTNGLGFLAPYRGVRYHLDEWGSGAEGSHNYKELYNLRHSKARNAIERSFIILKKRWVVLSSPAFYNIGTKNRMIMAYCLLHNFIRTTMVVYPIEVLVEESKINGIVIRAFVCAYFINNYQEFSSSPAK